MSTFESFLNELNKRKFTEQDKLSVWRKGYVVPGYDPNKYRKDSCGAWMTWSEYGNVNSEFGWEIDHIYPESLGGGNNISNLQPLQWQNNRAKGDSVAPYVCAVRATV